MSITYELKPELNVQVLQQKPELRTSTALMKHSFFADHAQRAKLAPKPEYHPQPNFQPEQTYYKKPEPKPEPTLQPDRMDMDTIGRMAESIGDLFASFAGADLNAPAGQSQGFSDGKQINPATLFGQSQQLKPNPMQQQKLVEKEEQQKKHEEELYRKKYSSRKPR